MLFWISMTYFECPGRPWDVLRNIAFHQSKSRAVRLMIG